jgi:hypothetical protein
VAHPLDSVRLKVLRTEEHLRELESEIGQWASRHPNAIVGKFEPETSDYVFRFRVFEPTHDRWGLLIGDSVHNARSALDHLACRLVELNGKTANRATQFPIFTTCSDFVRVGKRMVAKLDRRHLDMIEQLQPYHAGDNLPEVAGAHRIAQHPLTILNDLSNADKHRVFNTTFAVPRAVGFTPILALDCIIPDESDWTPNWGPLKNGSEVFRFPVIQKGPHPEVHLDQLVRVEVSLGYGEPAVETLGRIVEHLWNALDIFVSDFG